MITKRQADFLIKLLKRWEDKMISRFKSDNDIDRLHWLKLEAESQTLTSDYIYSLVDPTLE